MSQALADISGDRIAGFESADRSRPPASVVIPSLNRCAELEAALASLDAQRDAASDFEVIVVDDGSSDGTWKMLSEQWIPGAQAAQQRRIALRNERSIRPGRCRNLGACEARTELLVFLDSDCRAEPGWLAALIAPFDDPRVGVSGGAEVDHPDQPRVARAVHFTLTSPLTTGGVRGRTGTRAGQYRPRSFSMAVRRTLFERVGGFPDMFYGEDVDLSLRITELGFGARYAPTSRVQHARKDSILGVWRQAYSMGRARRTLLRRHSGHLELIYLMPAIAICVGSGVAIAALIWPEARPLAAGLFALSIAYLGLVWIVAQRTLRDTRTALLAPLVFAAQQLGYGIGFLFGVSRNTSAPPDPPAAPVASE